ncbi:protein phosphatase 1 [Amylocarpus encephaloides]|uniref:Protein phosphatase 1 n=1 Tax=Amylocarpus encephaloides TaxID=45428 RepID=A0A9P7YBE2_9HELO|nr:protein phosphatase 1 [Amylocarpus encephaloides]
MGHIRDKAGARSDLTSVEESESENDRARSPGDLADGEPLEDSYQESTQEPFSRPPSREGPPLQRLPVKQVDPDLLNHLKKYQEMSDMDGVIASSIRSIALAKEATEAIREADRITAEACSKLAGQEGFEETIESEPPNIRISENPAFHRKRKHSSSTVSHNTGGLEADFPSHGSNSSSGQSTTHSIPTGSSRGSDSRRVIAPHTVSHLIPEQLAGMVFDRDRNIWIKRKTASGESGKLNFLPSDETEDDPFGDIPDLSVDETQELQRIKLVAARLKQNVEDADEQDLSSLQKSAQEKQMQPGENVSEVLLPPILEQSPLLEAAESIYELPKTRPTPMETPFANKITKVSSEESKIEEAIEKEISIYEDRVGPATPLCRRHVTISFSSPLTSVIPPSPERDDSSILSMENDDEINQSESESFIVGKRKDKRSVSMKARSTTRKPSRRGSLGRPTFSTRPVSRIEERDEDATENNTGTRDRSFSIIMATPTVSMRTSSVVLATPHPAHDIGTLTLSPMSDFTIHQDDEPLGLNVSYVARNHRYSHGSESQRALSLTIKALVEKITEVEPYEPFWGHMKEIDLTDKKLTNLHKLDEFCAQLEEVDASNNRISQLDGLSRSVRNLHISHNCLTDLTAWSHLCNLQYIDVSNNELESLSAFKSLVHLRGIRADNNLITSISGVDQLDGLLSLRLRGNRVSSVDLRGTRLQRLTELDLRNNHLFCLRNLCELSSLTDLDVEDNGLENFCTDMVEAHTALKSLRLSGNHLEHIDVSLYSNLRLLYLDRNCLGSITGLHKTKHLDSLSLREQKDSTSLDLSFLSEAYEIRKLFLSGNLIHNFQPKFDFLNLQYLELANCGLETLQPNLGYMISNTRILNLNYNALTDITPLTGIVRLKKLHLAGNRLVNIKRTSTILSSLNGLTLVDLRADPMTQGFYPSVTESSVALNTAAGTTETIEPYTMAKADTGKDVKYARCLDMKTKMLRRVYEMMVLGGCRRLKMLDGLVNDRSSIKAKDEVWDALIVGGFISLPGANNQADNRRPEGSKGQGARGEGSNQGDTLAPQQRSTLLPSVQEEEMQEEEQESTLKPTEKSIFEERWCAEDSFA